MNFLFGIALGMASIALLLFSFVKDPHQDVRGVAPPLSFEQQVRRAQDVTAPEGEEEEEAPRQSRSSRWRSVSDEDDERISMEKNYQPPDHWKWKYESQRNVICEPLWDMPWRIVCHTNFERPVYRSEQPMPRREPQQRVVRHGPVIPARMPCRGGCPYYGD